MIKVKSIKITKIKIYLNKIANTFYSKIIIFEIHLLIIFLYNNNKCNNNIYNKVANFKDKLELALIFLMQNFRKMLKGYLF